MRQRVKSIIAALGVVAVAASTVVVLQTNADAYTGSGTGGAPAWVTGDAARKGAVLIYDGDGNQISQGADINNIGVSGLNTGWLAVSGGSLGSGAIRINGKLAAPDPTNAIPSTWATNDVPPLSYRWATATGVPAAVAATPAFLHLNTSGIAWQDIASGLVLYTGANADYKNVLEIRLSDNVDTNNYWAVDIEYNPTSAGSAYDGLAPGAWRVVWPQAVVAVGTTTTTPTVAPSGASHAFGTSLTFSTTVAAASGSIASGGTVTFFDGATQLGAGKAVGSAVGTTPVSVSSDAITDLAVGSHTITAQFTPGESGFNSSTSSPGLSQSITGISTSATAPVASPVSPTTFGTSVTFSTEISPSSGTLTGGTVTFKDGASTIGVAKTLVGSATSGSPVTVTSDATTSLTVGTHTITAEFTPSNAGYSSSTSSGSTFEVQAAPADATTTTLVASPDDTADSATDVVLTATVADNASSSHPTGSVTFKDGATVLGSVTLASGVEANKSVAAYTVGRSTIGLGTHSFTAEYVPSGNFSASTSNTLTYVITLAGPTNFGLPGVAGARVGFAGTCLPGAWLNAGAFRFTWYQRATPTSAWVQFSTAQSSGVLPAAYAAHQVKCSVVAYSPAATAGTTSVDSPVAVVALGVASRATVRPKILGTPAVGVTLKAYRGVWSPAPTTYLYVWKVGTKIVSRTAAFRPTALYRNKYLTLTVYAVRTGYLTGVASSVRVLIK